MIPAKKKNINANILDLLPNPLKNIKNIIKIKETPEIERIEVVANKRKEDREVEASIKRKDLVKEVNKKTLRIDLLENNREEINADNKEGMIEETNVETKEEVIDEINEDNRREMIKENKEGTKEGMKKLRKSVKKSVNKKDKIQSLILKEENQENWMIRIHILSKEKRLKEFVVLIPKRLKRCSKTLKNKLFLMPSNENMNL